MLLTKPVHGGYVGLCPLIEEVTVMHLIAIARNLQKGGHFFFTEKDWTVSPVLGCIIYSMVSVRGGLGDNLSSSLKLTG